MQSKMCEMFGIEVPIFAFSHCRRVVYRLINEYLEALEQVNALMPGD